MLMRSALRTATEYGVRLPNGSVHMGGLITDRREAEQRLARYRDFQYPDAELVQRTVTFGEWAPAEETP